MLVKLRRIIFKLYIPHDLFWLIFLIFLKLYFSLSAASLEVLECKKYPGWVRVADS